MTNQQYKNEIWKMQIAVRVSKYGDEIPPFYLKIYRQHYLLFYYQEIHQHFNRFQPQCSKISQITLNYKGIQLPYHVPFGVLFDMYHQEEMFTPIALVLEYSKEEAFKDIDVEIKNQLKFNLKWASYGRYNHEGFGVPLKLLQQYTKQTEEEKVFKLLKTFEELETIYSYYQKIFEDSNIIQFPIRIYFSSGQHLQTIIEIKDPTQTIGQALKTILQGGNFIFSGSPLDEKIPSLYFYQYFYNIDGFCYFVCR